MTISKYRTNRGVRLLPRRLLAIVVALWLAPFSHGLARAADALPFVLKPIGAGVYAAIDGPQGRSGSNAGVVIGDDGVLVVDSFFDPAATRALAAEIRRLTPKPIRYVVNTHYHVDHTGGDAVLRQAGAVIIAHRNVRGWVRTENIHLFGDRITPQRRAQVEALPLPDVVTDKDLTVWLGSRRVDVRTVYGHTGGDLVIGVPDAKVLFCGDMLWRRVSPNTIDGTVSQWIQTVAAFQRLPQASEITFVPGHGDVGRLADVADFEAYMDALASLTREARAAGLKDKALVDAVLPKLKARFGDWAGIDRMGPREIRDMDAELAGTKRVPVPASE